MTDALISVGIKGEVAGGRVVKRTLDDIGRSGSKTKRGMEGLRNEFKRTDATANLLRNTLATLGISFGLRQLQQVVDTYTNIQNRLKLVTNGSEELVGVTKELFAISNETRSAFESTAEVYSRVALATKEMGVSQRETLEFTKSLNQAVILSGASATEAAAGLIQLSQGLASGALRGDELRSVLEQLPAVADVIAQELGITRGELRKMGEEGKITAEIVMQAFASAREELNEKFAKTVPTIGQSFVVLKNRVIEFTGELDEATGASARLSELIIALSKNIDILAVSIAAAGAAWVVYRGYATAAIGTTVLAAVAGNITAFAQLAMTVRSVSGAMVLLNATFMVGPGAFIAVLAAAGVAAYTFRREIKVTVLSVLTEIIILADKAAASINRLFGREGNLSGLSAEELRSSLDDIILESGQDDKSKKGKITEPADVQKLKQEIREAASAQTEFNQKLSEGRDTLPDIQKGIEKISYETDRFANSAAQAFTDFVTGASSAKDALRSLINDVIQLASRQFITAPLSGALGSIFSGISSGLSGGFGSFGASTGSNVVASSTGIPGFASGGSMVLGGNAGVDQNVLSLNGMPIAKTGRGETLSVSPAQKGNKGSGITINQTFNVSTGVQETVRAEFMALMPELQKSTIAAVENARQRGYET